MTPTNDTDAAGQRDAAILQMRSAAAEFAMGLGQLLAGRLTPLRHQVTFLKKLDSALEGLGITGRQIDCQKGCAYCCHYHVYITAEEALALAELIDSAFTPEQQRSLKHRLQENAALVSSMSADEHIATNVKCAFLAEDLTCQVYETRPLACRRHHSYKVASCIETFNDPSSTSQNLMSADRRNVADGFAALSLAISKNAGVDVARYEMSTAVLEALTNKASYRRWKDGKVAFPGVKDRDPSGGAQGLA